jgi:hypothetical protein
MKRTVGDEGRTFSGKPVAIVIGALLIIAALIKWWPSDERDIRHQLDALADILSVPPVESDLSRTARLADLRSYFSDSVQVRLPEQHIPNRDALMAIAESYHPPPGGIFIEFVNENISLPGDNTAHVIVTTHISRRNASNGETDVEERQAALDLAKRRGDWLITNVEQQEPASPAVQ